MFALNILISFVSAHTIIMRSLFCCDFSPSFETASLFSVVVPTETVSSLSSYHTESGEYLELKKKRYKPIVINLRYISSLPFVHLN